MESNEQTGLTGKTETDSSMESRWQLVEGWRLGGGRIEQKGKKGLMDTDHGVVIAAGRKA